MSRGPTFILRAMVTFGEFLRHVLTAGVTMTVSLLVLVAFAHRYDDARGFVRKAAIALPVCIGLVALLSITSGVTEARCTRDPREWCRYNDNVPFMATVAMIFSGLMLTRALLVWFYRPVKSTHGFFDAPPSHQERRDHRAQG